MRFNTLASAASLAAVATAAANERTFAVLRFDGDGFMTEGRLDPIVNPGTLSAHHHGVMGGSGFGKTVEKDDLLKSKCTSAKIANDKSNYWVPTLWFQSPTNGTLYKVPLWYMNVYYFFEPTDDKVVAFPPGLKMLVGDPATRDPPKGGGAVNYVDNGKPIQPIQFTCPRTDNNVPLYPVGSDGTKAGIQDPTNKGTGAGFPFRECDGFASPLRQDIHFPSCYNPKAGLDDYKNNMAWPKQEGWKQNCPEGYIHVPHIFFEVYWNTPLFVNEWDHDGTSQPFVFSNGDATGYSSHGDFLAGWDENTLQTIIDTCNAGDIGMDKCPNIPGGLNTDNNCKTVVEDDVASKSRFVSNGFNVLPGGNKVTGWGKGGVSGGSVGSPDVPEADSSSSSSSSDNKDSSDSAPAAASPAVPVKAAVAKEKEEKPASPAPQPTQAPVEQPSPVQGGAGAMKTVWDVVTVTDYTTTWAEPTAAAKREEHAHDHMARHINRRNRRSS